MNIINLDIIDQPLTELLYLKLNGNELTHSTDNIDKIAPNILFFKTKIDYYFTSLPSKLLFLKLRNWGRESIIPQNLLYFECDYTENVDTNTLPSSLKFLIFNYNLYIGKPINLPPNLIKLKLGNYFDEQIIPPKTLKTLILSDEYPHRIVTDFNIQFILYYALTNKIFYKYYGDEYEHFNY